MHCTGSGRVLVQLHNMCSAVSYLSLKCNATPLNANLIFIPISQDRVCPRISFSGACYFLALSWQTGTRQEYRVVVHSISPRFVLTVISNLHARLVVFGAFSSFHTTYPLVLYGSYPLLLLVLVEYSIHGLYSL